MQFRIIAISSNLVSQFHKLWLHRWLLLQLVIVEIKLRYRKSFLGVIWAIMNPILNATILYFVFRAIFKIKALGEIDFFPYVYSGVLLVNFFTQSVIQASEQLSNNAPVLRRVNIPGEVFILSSVLTNIVNFIFGFIPLFFYFFISHHRLPWRISLIIFLVISLSFIILAISLFLSIAYVYFQDLRYLIPVLLTLVFYLTPVFYDLEAIGGRTRVIMNLNPLVSYLDAFRFFLGITGQLNLPYLMLFSFVSFILFLMTLLFMDKNRMKAVFLS